MCTKGGYKFTLITINVLFLACGIFMVTSGSMMQSGKKVNVLDSILRKFDEAGSINSKQLYPIFIVAGSITIIVSFLGLCGGFFENRIALLLYAIAVGFLLVMQITLFILAFTNRSKLDKVFNKLFDKLQEGIKLSNKPDVDTVVGLQESFRCCGVKSRLDWPENEQLTRCREGDALGCKQAVIVFLNGNIKIIAVALGVFIAIETLGIIAASCVLYS